MAIADKLKTIAENEPKVYEAGKKAESDRFWDVFQKNGAKSNYNYAMCGVMWTDEIYNPSYDIVCSGAVNMFRNAYITDSKVTIDIRGANGTYMFFECPRLKTVRKVIVNESNAFTGSFQNCPALEEIRFEGVIGKNLDLHWSVNLSVNSVEDIIEHLGGTASATLTLPARFKEIDDYLIVIEGKPSNWTVAYL